MSKKKSKKKNNKQKNSGYPKKSSYQKKSSNKKKKKNSQYKQNAVKTPKRKKPGIKVPIVVFLLILMILVIILVIDSNGDHLKNNVYEKQPSQAFTQGKLDDSEIARLNAGIELETAKAKVAAMKYPIKTVEDFKLILVNKTHPLSKKYYPNDLVKIYRCVESVGTDEIHQMRAEAAEHLNEMFDAAEKDGIDIKLRNGFRPYDYQKKLYGKYVKKEGKEKADTYSARPGFSEHQTGLACDLGGKTEDYALSSDFGKTKEGKWVAKHAHEYGFIIRYTDGKTNASGEQMPGKITGYIFEPWHIRYVGEEHAKAIYEQGITLEEYLNAVDDAEYK